MILDLFRLDGQAAIVTGAGQGIGRGIASALAEAGAAVVVADRNAETAERTAAELLAQGLRAMPFVADLRRALEVANLAEATVREFGRLDILVNNAGGGFNAATLDLSENAWDAIMNVNVKTAFLASRECVRYMREHGGGAIANIASVAGVDGSPGRPPYGAAKAAIINLTKSWAAEWAPYRVRVNAVAPGTILSGPGVADLWPSPEAQAAAAARVPLGRMGQPQDIAAAILFLVSGAAAWVTGQTLVVDGGPRLG